MRRMQPADLGRILEIAASLNDAPHWPPAVYLAAMDPRHAPPRIALVAGTASDLAAPAAFAVASLVAPQAELETIAVDAAAQRRGLAGILLKTLVRDLKIAGVAELHLEVRSSNAAALAFYRAGGFSQVGKRPRYYTDPAEDAMLMCLPIR